MAKLKILSCNPNGGAFFYIMRSIGNAFRALGHEFKVWDGDPHSAAAYQPDIYLGSSGWRQQLPKLCVQRGTKIGVHVNPFGTEVLQPVPGGPNINEPDAAIDWVISQNPKFLFCYGYQDDINLYWDKWTSKFGLHVAGVPTAGDSTIHRPVEEDKRFKADIGFVGGYWPYKKINLDKYIMPLIKRYKMSLYGWGGWGKLSKGTIEDSGVNSLFSSVKICPAISEPHTNIYGIDIPERMFKTSLCGAFVIADPMKGIRRYYSSDELVVAESPNDFMNKVEHFLNNPDERNFYRKNMRLRTLRDHTYFSRVATILSAADYIDESSEARSYAIKEYESAKIKS